jgi:periplasmic copper chaperone A
MNRTTITATLALAATIALPTAAGAHVTLQPSEAPAGGFARLDVRVPNESDDTATNRVVVQMPAGFAGVRYEPEPGWRTAVSMRRLAEPVTAEGEDEAQTEEVDEISFTATGAASAIEPGEFRDFGISVRLPERSAGTKLTFKSLQTYDDGEVVRWIGPPDSEKPAPQVTLTAAAAQAGDDETDGADGLAIVALVVGGSGLLAGAAALLGARRARTA